MSSEQLKSDSGSATIDRSPEDLADLLGEYVIDRDDHLNAPGFVVRPDDVATVLGTLRNEVVSE